MESIRDGFAVVRGNIDSGIRRASGGPLSGAGSSSSSRLQADEDIELPILEATTALSDGYASPRPLDYHEGFDAVADTRADDPHIETRSKQEEDDDERDVELGEGPPALPKSVVRRRGCCGCCRGACSFVLAHWSKAVVLAIVITIIVLFSVRGVRIFGEILHFFERWNNWAGWGIFIGVFIVNVTLFLPGVALVLGAGYIFGFWKGLLACWAGGAIGQVGAFLLARYLVRELVVTYVAKKWPKWDLIEHMLEAEGWKIILLLRLSPIVPWNLLNIAMASTNVPFWQFAIASAIGIGFETSVLCYFGSLAHNIREIVSGDAKPQGPVVYVLAGVSVFTAVLAATLASISVKRALRRADAFKQAQGDDGDGGTDGGNETYAFLPQALPPEGPTFASHGGGLNSGDLYAPSDGGSPRNAPRRQLADTLQSNSGFDSDESGGLCMVPMSGGGGNEAGSSIYGSAHGSAGSYIMAHGLSPASSDDGGGVDLPTANAQSQAEQLKRRGAMQRSSSRGGGAYGGGGIEMWHSSSGSDMADQHHQQQQGPDAFPAAAAATEAGGVAPGARGGGRSNLDAAGRRVLPILPGTEMRSLGAIAT